MNQLSDTVRVVTAPGTEGSEATKVAKAQAKRKKGTGTPAPAPKVEEKQEEPTKEELEALRVQNAQVVLDEMERWPAEVLAAIGEDHPSSEAFLKGPSHLIGAYMHIARTNIDRQARDLARAEELGTAKKLSEIDRGLSALRENFQKTKKQQLISLRKQRDKEMREASEEVRNRYRALIRDVENRDLPTEVQVAEQKEADVQAEYRGACSGIELSADIVRDMISEIAEGADNWKIHQRSAKKRARELKKSRKPT